MIETGIHSPMWMNNTRICLRYDPFRHNQCGGINGLNPTCAYANSWTANFRDDTHDADHDGCEMQWAIFDEIEETETPSTG